MGGKGSGKTKAKAKEAPPQPLPAQGTGGKKRTPQSFADPAAGKDIYEPEAVVAERLVKGCLGIFIGYLLVSIYW